MPKLSGSLWLNRVHPTVLFTVILGRGVCCSGVDTAWLLQTKQGQQTGQQESDLFGYTLQEFCLFWKCKHKFPAVLQQGAMKLQCLSLCGLSIPQNLTGDSTSIELLEKWQIFFILGWTFDKVETPYPIHQL